MIFEPKAGVMNAPARNVNGTWLCGDCGSSCTVASFGAVRPIDVLECTKCGRSDVASEEEAA